MNKEERVMPKEIYNKQCNGCPFSYAELNDDGYCPECVANMYDENDFNAEFHEHLDDDFEPLFNHPEFYEHEMLLEHAEELYMKRKDDYFIDNFYLLNESNDILLKKWWLRGEHVQNS